MDQCDFTLLCQLFWIPLCSPIPNSVKIPALPLDIKVCMKNVCLRIPPESLQSYIRMAKQRLQEIAPTVVCVNGLVFKIFVCII
jgi:hypothetical protein